MHSPKIYPKTMKKIHEIMKKKCKKKGNIDIPANGERNLARNLEENEKKNRCGALPSRREKKF